MAANLPINFAVPNEGIINSYTFTDIINGAGYVKFYPEVFASAGAVAAAEYPYLLNTYNFLNTTTAVSLRESTYPEWKTSPFAFSRTINGIVIVNMTSVNIGGTGTMTFNVLLLAENAAGTRRTLKQHNVTTDGAHDGVYLFNFLVSNQKINVGEKLIFKTQIVGSGSGTTGNFGAVGCQIYIPFKTEL